MEFLRSGGMAELWKARDAETGATVVVKTLRRTPWSNDMGDRPSELRQRTELLKRFDRESRLMAQLDHPGIPRPLHHGYYSGEPYLVMEYIEGRSLQEFLRRFCPVPLDAVAAIMVQHVDALACAHAAGVVHRDLKPSNLIVGSDGTVFLIDFGIAYLTDPDATRYTEFGSTPGSPGYKAPEIIKGVRQITEAADLYSCGCMLFELLTARPPFADKPDRSVDYQHLHDVPPRPRDLKPSVPAEVDDLTWRLLDKDPSRRPGIDEVSDTLRPYLPAPGAPAPSPELVPDPTARYRNPRHPVHTSQAKEVSRMPNGWRSARRRAARPSRAEFARMVSRAEEELVSGDVGQAVEVLNGALRDVSEAWGLRDAQVARAQLLCADAHRLEGDWPRAGALYRAIDRALASGGSAETAPIAIKARLGIAECLVPERDLEGAVAGWSAVARQVIELRPAPRTLVHRLREIAWDLDENGYGARIAHLLSLLPDE